jgi:hypothetical protein
MTLIRILIALSAITGILIVGIVIGSMLRVRRIDRENKLMEEILKRYGKDKTTGGTRGSGDAGDTANGGDIPHRL